MSKLIHKTREYLDYLENHIENICRAFQEITDACEDMPFVSDAFTWEALRQQVINHDISKFSMEEFTQYRESFFPVNESPSVPLDPKAWEHHTAHNHHHHQTAQSQIDIVHMIIDWTAMGYYYQDTAQEFYNLHKDEMNISLSNTEFILEIFKRIETN